MQVYVYKLLVSNMQVSHGFYALTRVCAYPLTLKCRGRIPRSRDAKQREMVRQKQALNRVFDKGLRGA